MLTRIFPDEFLATTATVAVLVSIVSFGCEEERSWKQPGPEATFENFLMDWYRGEYDRAFDTIVPEDRAELTAPLDELEGKLDKKNLPQESDMLVVGRVDNPYDIKDIELEKDLQKKPSKGQKVTLTLSYHDGREGSATMVWGGDQWFVDLPLAGQQGEPSGPDSADTPAEEPSGDAGSPSENAGTNDAGTGDAASDRSHADSGDEQEQERQENDER